ncbi:ATP-dependent Clp protease ClpC [Bacteroidia bacterium]|nr:ATP-dependent Clp protease ClpC [Bacteroidia bacterium]
MATFNIKMSEELTNVIKYSHEEALRLRCKGVKVEHLMLGILRSNSQDIFNNILINVDASSIKNSIELHVKNTNTNVSYIPKDNDSEQLLPLSPQAESIFKLMQLEAQDLKAKEIGIVHLFLAIMRSSNFVSDLLLANYSLEYSSIKRQLLKGDKGNNTSLGATEEDIDDNDIDTMKSSFLKNTEGRKKDIEALFNIDDDDDDDDDDDIDEFNKKSHTNTNEDSRRLHPASVNIGGNVAKSKTRTPALDAFGKDLTQMARSGKLDPVVGRSEELKRIAVILSRRKKNNPILIGEAGVGKTAIVEGLALNIINGNVPRVLIGKRLISLDIASMVAGTKYRGQFEERIKSLLSELEKSSEIILFIDEIHTMVGAGDAGGSLDASNIFKPALARGEIQCIGSTTLSEYRKNIESDAALERRFQKIMVDPTTEEETLTILKNIRKKYEDHHLVRYTEDALKACVYLTSRYLSDRFLPDKAIDALDEAGANVSISSIVVPKEITEIEQNLANIDKESKRLLANNEYVAAVNIRNKKEDAITKLKEVKKLWEKDIDINRPHVTSEDIAKTVSKMSGVPVTSTTQDEKHKLLTIEQDLKESVIGQDKAISKIVKAIRRNRVGLKDPNKPIGNFIFLGTTGVGKTHLAKMLAKNMFGNEDSLIRIDMSEYSEGHTVSRLIGAPPGYVGYGEGGLLTEKVRRKPYSIVLLDEIEKAHQDLFNILLQVLGEGHLTDGLGRKVDFKNTIIIMTSNVGTKEAKDFGDGIGFVASNNKSERIESLLNNALKKVFSPEFLNRIDDIVVFESLNKDDIYKIFDIELCNIKLRIESKNIVLNVSDDAKNFIVEKSWNADLGARPLQRAIQTYIEDPISEEILKYNVNFISAEINISLSDDGKDIAVSSTIKSEVEKQIKNELGVENISF